MAARPKGATPPKPAKQGGMVHAHTQQPKQPTGTPGAASAPQQKQTNRGFKPSPIGGTGKGAH
jgi:hypothetical protein